MDLENIIRKQPCSACGGRGSWQEMGEESCISCCGTGRKGGMIIDLPNDDMWCCSCRGTGRKAYCRTKCCGACNGSGNINF